ncbi:hypothetical protein FOFC_20038 [Fusarium oxysporum]|nr:hypothetical protein FOFC_20038 [Fusarium oxysporum]
MHIGQVILADTDETASSGGDDVLTEDGVDGTKGESTISRSISEFVLGDASILGTDDGDVDARETFNAEASDRNSLDKPLDRGDSLVLSLVLGCLDLVASDADTSLELILLLILGETSACIALVFLRLGEADDAMGFKLNAILINDELLRVFTSLNDDAITRRGPLDGVLDLLAGLDVDSATISVVVLCVGWRRVLVLVGDSAAVLILPVALSVSACKKVSCSEKGEAAARPTRPAKVRLNFMMGSKRLS